MDSPRDWRRRCQLESRVVGSPQKVVHRQRDIGAMRISAPDGARTSALNMPRPIFVGTAGWSIPRALTHRCPSDGTHLQRYSRTFGCAEINSSFHRPHAADTYAKWAASTPRDFRFSVKVPRDVTHDHQLRRVRIPLQRFLEETDGLGPKRGPLLVQLPPSHGFDARVAGRFLELLRREYEGAVVCEPRHETWFSSRANALLVQFNVARVAADPAPVVGADRPGGWAGLVYYRLHGTPRKYWSKYGASYLRELKNALHSVPPPIDTWCVFDNTASGAALENAFELSEVLGILPVSLRPAPDHR